MDYSYFQMLSEINIILVLETILSKNVGKKNRKKIERYQKALARRYIVLL